jgi:hypothetical protein
VKIEADSSHGGLSAGGLQGIWVYQRQGQEVVGYFSGNLRGNVLQFRWQEPNNPPLTGEGYMVFDVLGRQYAGRWWSDKRDRVGDWNGWRWGAGKPRPRGASTAARGTAARPTRRPGRSCRNRPRPRLRRTVSIERARAAAAAGADRPRRQDAPPPFMSISPSMSPALHRERCPVGDPERGEGARSGGTAATGRGACTGAARQGDAATALPHHEVELAGF